jgi:hypothetical protein
MSTDITSEQLIVCIVVEIMCLCNLVIMMRYLWHNYK